MDNEFRDILTSLPLQIGYGIGHVLNDVCASLWFTYLQVFFHLVLEFTSAQAGTLMLIGQVADALATPFVGYCSDNTSNTRYGKRKLWHLFGSVCVLASFPFIFSECLECSTSHTWAQMYYFAAFIVIFQIGWASVQISHLSLIPELSEDFHTRKQLTVIRYGFTVFSNLYVYIITWVVLHVTGQCDKQQIGPQDLWKFRNIVYIVLATGSVALITFHVSVKEKPNPRQYNYLNREETNSGAHQEFLRRPSMYQVATVYMSTRIVVNVSQVLIPLYLHRSLGLAARSLAVVPLAMYLGSLSATAVQRFTPRSCTRKINYVLGALCAAVGFVWIYLDTSETYKVSFIYVVAVLIGFGGAIMLVTSLALTADLIGEKTEASAFVYGLMSFTDKLSCGITIAVIQFYADGSSSWYYRDILSWVCGAATLLGLLATVTLPTFTPVVATDESTATIQSTIQDDTEQPSDVL